MDDVQTFAPGRAVAGERNRARGHSIECRAGIALGVIDKRISVEKRGVSRGKLPSAETESVTLSMGIPTGVSSVSPTRRATARRISPSARNEHRTGHDLEIGLDRSRCRVGGIFAATRSGSFNAR
jgi:hypothetical protein